MWMVTMLARVDDADEELLDLDEDKYGDFFEITIFDPKYGPGGYTILHDQVLDTIDETFEDVGLRIVDAPPDDIRGDYVVEPIGQKTHPTGLIAKKCWFHRL